MAVRAAGTGGWRWTKLPYCDNSGDVESSSLAVLGWEKSWYSTRRELDGRGGKKGGGGLSEKCCFLAASAKGRAGQGNGEMRVGLCVCACAGSAAQQTTMIEQEMEAKDD